jgi:hypothetical protein
MTDPGHLMLLLLVLLLWTGILLAVVLRVRGGRVPPHVRVAQLRQELRAARHRTEVRVRPLRYRRLSVEMILLVARSEGFRLVAERAAPGRGRRTELVLSAREEAGP